MIGIGCAISCFPKIAMLWVPERLLTNERVRSISVILLSGENVFNRMKVWLSRYYHNNESKDGKFDTNRPIPLLIGSATKTACEVVYFEKQCLCLFLVNTN